MIKLIDAHSLGGTLVDLTFSDGAHGVWSGDLLLQRQGPLLEPLRDEEYFKRFFIEAGALCWPNGLELSPARLRETALSSLVA